MREIEIAHEVERVLAFIRDYTQKSGFTKLILGLSGGIDSALSAALAVKAIGRENVIGLMLPGEDSHPDSLQDARLLAEHLGIRYEVHSIAPLVKAWFANSEPEADRLRIGNWKARCRMMVLYDLSAKYKALVVGTSNRTELLVGYFTQFGDGACAFEPIGHLYKTEVKQMAAFLGIPVKIIDKAPTADLWEGQTDEEEMGITYPVLDDILYALTEENLNIKASTNFKHPVELYHKVQKMIYSSEYKRKAPPALD
ncbi:MAG: NAD+ synthase [Candidatus Cloacimonadaceae bacterium]|nr:NAD+ synthase [Candidatus Cloacimonadaceae bacterium]